MSNEIPNFRKQNAQKYNKNKKFRKISKESSKASVNEKKSGEKLPRVSKLPSNWDKYNDAFDDSETLPFLEIDFDGIPGTPGTAKQFQLKQDKAFLPEEDAKFDSPDFFELDMNLISLSLATIPFYTRMGMKQIHLTEQEIEEMNKNAVEANISYQSYLAKRKIPENDSLEEIVEEDSKREESPELPAEEQVTHIASHREHSTEEAELEAWLEGLI